MGIKIMISIAIIFSRDPHLFERVQRFEQMQQVQYQQKVIMSEQQINTEKILECLGELEK